MAKKVFTKLFDQSSKSQDDVIEFEILPNKVSAMQKTDQRSLNNEETFFESTESLKDVKGTDKTSLKEETFFESIESVKDVPRIRQNITSEDSKTFAENEAGTEDQIKSTTCNETCHH